MNNTTKARKYNAKRANRGKARTRSRRQRKERLARTKRVCAGGSLMIELRPTKTLKLSGNMIAIPLTQGIEE